MNIQSNPVNSGNAFLDQVEVININAMANSNVKLDMSFTMTVLQGGNNFDSIMKALDSKGLPSLMNAAAQDVTAELKLFNMPADQAHMEGDVSNEKMFGAIEQAMNYHIPDVNIDELIAKGTAGMEGEGEDDLMVLADYYPEGMDGEDEEKMAVLNNPGEGDKPHLEISEQIKVLAMQKIEAGFHYSVALAEAKMEVHKENFNQVNNAGMEKWASSAENKL